MPRTPAPLLVLALATLSFLLPGGALAHVGGEPGTGGPYERPPEIAAVELGRGETPCRAPDENLTKTQVIEGVPVRASRHCNPDDPRWIAAFVKGTNNVPQELLDEVRLHRDAVVKGDDLDGDGDPDVIHIRLEVQELNGWHLPEDVTAGEGFAIAPGIRPGFWVFAPKASGAHGGPTDLLVRMPSPPIRVEQGDSVRVTLENAHYLPHTIHFHGVDHPFLDADGEGNDGVPGASEAPVLPGATRTYEFTPRVPGTMFYHCHVQPQVHVEMGLNGLIIVEEDRPDNWLQTLNVGGGDVRHPSKAVLEEYHREYDLHYQNMDRELHVIVQEENDPRVLEERLHRVYDVTEATSDYFLLNGRSFPYTLRESVVVVAPDERVKLRVLSGGSAPIALHTHGHKPTATHLDGIADPSPVTRDVHWVAAAQRVDLALNTTNDGLHAYGPGVWFMHDHQEEAVTTDGINPGGDITVVAYESFLEERTHMPRAQAMGWDLFFDEAYYRGEVSPFHMLDPENFGPLVNTSDQDEEQATAPGPAPLLVLVALVLALTAARWRR